MPAVVADHRSQEAIDPIPPGRPSGDGRGATISRSQASIANRMRTISPLRQFNSKWSEHHHPAGAG
jgi:hypothetical protein